MKKIAAVALIAILSLTCAAPIYAGTTEFNPDARAAQKRAQKLAKKQQNALKKQAEQQKKAFKKAAKAQQKAFKKAQKEAAKSNRSQV